MKKALIFDLDNTIFPVSAIGDELFDPLFRLIEENGNFHGKYDDIKRDVMSKPFQWVAAKYEFSEDLTRQGNEILTFTTYNKLIEPFNDYFLLKDFDVRRFIVTAGYFNMQSSKISVLSVKEDFEQTIIIDPMITDDTKKDAFIEILSHNELKCNEVLIIGDDKDSEFRYARELGVDAVLYDKAGLNKDVDIPEKVSGYKEVLKYLMKDSFVPDS